MKEYDHKAIEKKWQKEWADRKIFEAKDYLAKDKFYFLVEFPYPSGNLHVGHWYAFAVPDIAARFYRMNGKNVLFPMGFDAFGLPAENAAIKRGLNPKDWTFSNIDYMRHQLKSIGASYDWSREVITCDPQYYKWTQWLFLKLFEKGLVYQGKSEVNWCPKDKTVLANEQVINGRCERCGSIVELKRMLQWHVKITEYADRLIDDLENLDWPKSIKDAQKNWIGKSQGAEIEFKTDRGEKIKIFTTRPDTIFGATFLVKAAAIDRFTGRYAENPATKEKIPIWEAEYVVSNYGTGAIMAVPAHDQRDFEFAKKYNLPIKEVLIPRMTDVHDPPQKDIKTVERTAVRVVLVNPKNNKILVLKWKKLPWTTFITGGIDENENPIESAKREIYEETGYKNVKFIRHLGKNESHFFARHKNENRKALFWNMVFELENEERDEPDAEEKEIHEGQWMSWEELDKDKGLKGSEYHMIVEHFFNPPHAYEDDGILIDSGEFSGTESNEAKKKITEFVGGEFVTTYHLRDWVVSRQRYWGVPIPIIHCKKCGVVAVPEKDLPVLLPEIDDYLPRDDGKSPLSKVRDWVEADCPKCGGDAERETDTLDTFVDSSWYFLRYADPKNDKIFADPKKLKQWMPVDFYSGGAEHTTMHLLYSRFWHKALFDIGLVFQNEPYLERMNRGLIWGPDSQKMSKSRGNVIDPDKEVERLGADTMRMYLAFIGPYNEVGAYPWNPDSAIGVRKFLERVWKLREKVIDTAQSNPIINSTIKKVGKNISNMKMNTAISALMIAARELQNSSSISKKDFEIFLKLLSPFAPHIAEEIWRSLGRDTLIIEEKWPEADLNKFEETGMKIIIQVNSRVRADFTVSVDVSQTEIENKAKSLPKIQKWLFDKQIKRIIYIPNKLINFVTS